MAKSNCARVLVVDDHRIVRLGFRRLLEEVRCRTVAGEASSGEEALEMFDRVDPDLVITDISMKEMSGIELTRQLKRDHPDVRVLMVSMHNESLYVRQAFDVGADGYVFKENIDGVMEEASEAVLNGKQYLCAGARQLVADG